MKHFKKMYRVEKSGTNRGTNIILLLSAYLAALIGSGQMEAMRLEQIQSTCICHDIKNVSIRTK